MFKITQYVLEKTEAHILNLPSENKLWSLFTRYIVFPFKYLTLGLKDFFKPAPLSAMLAFALMVISAAASQKFNIEAEYLIVLFNLCFIAPAVIVIFAVPSTYAYSGVELNYINVIVDYIKEKKLDSEEKIELLMKNLDEINIRISSRISFYKWLIATSWALYVVIFNIELKLILKTEELNINKIIVDNISSFAFMLFLAFVALLLIVGYKRASEILIKSIKFACIEHKFNLLQNS